MFRFVGKLLLALAGLAAIAVTNPVRADFLYGVTFGEQLISINTANGAGAFIGNLSSPMAAMGLDYHNGQLYTFDQTADRLRTLNPLTGATTSTVNVGLSLGGEGGLAIRSDGQGFINSSSGATGTLFNFSLTGLPPGAQVGSSGGMASMDGLAFDSADVLYGIGQHTSGNRNLYIINQTTGVATVVGGTGLTQNFVVGGLDFDSAGNLYAALSDLNGQSLFYSINKNTGAATFIGNIGFNGVSGIAFEAIQEVPVPAGMILLLTGAIPVIGLRLYRRRVAVTV